MRFEEELAIYDAFINNFGVESQLKMLQEECAELIVAVSKMLRNTHDAETNLVEELADAQNMINQIKRFYPKMETIREEKLLRAALSLKGKNAQ